MNKEKFNYKYILCSQTVTQFGAFNGAPVANCIVPLDDIRGFTRVRMSFRASDGVTVGVGIFQRAGGAALDNIPSGFLFNTVNNQQVVTINGITSSGWVTFSGATLLTSNPINNQFNYDDLFIVLLASGGGLTSSIDYAMIEFAN